MWNLKPGKAEKFCYCNRCYWKCKKIVISHIVEKVEGTPTKLLQEKAEAKVFLEISQNSQENTYVRVSFSTK